MAELPAILDGFYDHVSRFEETRRFFASREHMMAAKAAQLRHWSTIMDGRFDGTYEASIRRIGEAHHRIGLDPRWYIGGYNAVVAGLLRAIGEKLVPAQKGLFQRGAAGEDVIDGLVLFRLRFRLALFGRGLHGPRVRSRALGKCGGGERARQHHSKRGVQAKHVRGNHFQVAHGSARRSFFEARLMCTKGYSLA